jgi:methionyl-tRNA formyltransferase
MTVTAMLDTIVLLAGPAEQTLTQVLIHKNPRLTVIAAATPADLAAIRPDVLARARLIGFVTPVIVPPDVLAALGYGAYNFHPGPPHYPGWAPTHFALYDRASEFGATVHEMAELVDSGPIINVSMFPVPADASVGTLEGLAYAHLAKMFWQMSASLATSCELLPTIAVRWNETKKTRRDYRALCDIPPDISGDELRRRLKVFGANHFEIAPTIRLHGIEFRAVAQISQTSAMAASHAQDCCQQA